MDPDPNYINAYSSSNDVSSVLQVTLWSGVLARLQAAEVPPAQEEAARQAPGAHEEEEEHQVLREEGKNKKI